MYYKTVPMTLEEAVIQEASKGFDSWDEFQEVIRDIAREYNSTFSFVLTVFCMHSHLQKDPSKLYIGCY